MRRVDSLYARLPTQETLTRRPLCPTRIRTPPAAWDKFRVKRGQYRRPVPAETGHSLGPTSPPMQTAPPSRIMLGGAVLKPDSAIPGNYLSAEGAIRFDGQRQLRRPYPSISRNSCSWLAACSSPPCIRACRPGRSCCSSGSAAPPTTPPATSGVPMGRVVQVGTQVTIQGHDPGQNSA